MSFMNAVKNTLNEDFNYSVTENGALGIVLLARNWLT